MRRRFMDGNDMESRSRNLDARLAALEPERLRGMRRGVEKESLRVQPDGALALTPHPAALGAALTHPRITTDFSESQLELITGVHRDAAACLHELTQIHQFVHRTLDRELLWAASMPCGLPADDAIPLAQFGPSNIGRAKTVYRMGLSHRYGRRMQTISGIHYNWSLPGLGNDEYLALIRNFRRHAFLLIYLFGASPAVCESFIGERPHDLQRLAGHTLGLPHATSLRMGPLGYQSEAQAALGVSYNSLARYAASLEDALTRVDPGYEAIGLRGPDGEYRQLATTVLQIENEFYGTIRPKRVIHPGERPLHALRERGVEYIEVRCLDLDPFEPIGIGMQTLHFLDVFLLHCLLADSPPDSPQEILALSRNQERVATHGREPGLRLERAGGEVLLTDWARGVLEGCGPIAARLDALHGGSAHTDAVAAARAAVANAELTPSARVLSTMARDFDRAYVRFVLAQSAAARRQLLALPWTAADEAHWRQLSAQSLAEQRAHEEADTLPFEAFRQAYLASAGLQPVAA